MSYGKNAKSNVRRNYEGIREMAPIGSAKKGSESYESQIIDKKIICFIVGLIAGGST